MRDVVDSFPRLPLVPQATPLEHTPPLAAALDFGRDLWVKRDDLTGPGLGGNKVRKLEYLLAAARGMGCDALVTVGAAQSNHARLTAITGAAAGFDVHLVLGDGEPSEIQGNLVLDHLAGATLHHAESTDWAVLDEAHQEVVSALERDGRRPYPIPMGGSTPVGALGYVRAYLEILGQLEIEGRSAAAIVHASSTGGTQAGLLAGRALTRAARKQQAPIVVGVDVAKTGDDLGEDVLRLANDVLALLEVDAHVADDDVLLVDAAGGAYGEVTHEGARALVAGLRTSGLVTDPVYSAKALGALGRLETDTVVAANATVVFLHTGGQPALFTDRYATDVIKTGGTG